jgi:hypothetical protein
MRFTRKLPSEDTCKDKKKFAWLPVTIKVKNDKGEKIGETIIWLEYYKAVYRYSYGSWDELYSRRELL